MSNNKTATIVAHFNTTTSTMPWAEYRCVIDENGFITVLDSVDCESGDVTDVYLVDENGDEHTVSFDEEDAASGLLICDEKALMPCSAAFAW